MKALVPVLLTLLITPCLAQTQPPVPRSPLGCMNLKVVSYCVPNTTKYQVCSPTVKVVQCPIDSSCKEALDAKGNKIAFCKYIG